MLEQLKDLVFDNSSLNKPEEKLVLLYLYSSMAFPILGVTVYDVKSISDATNIDLMKIPDLIDDLKNKGFIELDDYNRYIILNNKHELSPILSTSDAKRAITELISIESEKTKNSLIDKFEKLSNSFKHYKIISEFYKTKKDEIIKIYETRTGGDYMSEVMKYAENIIKDVISAKSLKRQLKRAEEKAVKMSKEEIEQLKKDLGEDYKFFADPSVEEEIKWLIENMDTVYTIEGRKQIIEAIESYDLLTYLEYSFEHFMQEYPIKEGSKINARKEWFKLSPSPEEYLKIIENLSRQKKSDTFVFPTAEQYLAKRMFEIAELEDKGNERVSNKELMEMLEMDPIMKMAYIYGFKGDLRLLKEYIKWIKEKAFDNVIFNYKLIKEFAKIKKDDIIKERREKFMLEFWKNLGYYKSPGESDVPEQYQI